MPSKTLRAALRLAAFGLLVAIPLTGPIGCGTDGVTGIGDTGGIRLAVFASDRGQSQGQFDLYLWDMDTYKFRSTPSLNSFVAERHPSISSDGRFIAFQVNRGAGGGDDIEMYDRTGQPSYFVTLTGLNSTASETEPAFTGDGLKLSFVQVDASGRRRIRLYNGQTKTGIPLPGLDTTGATFDDFSPAPNRDGSVIAFVTSRNGTSDIYLYDRARQRIVDVPELRSAGEDVDPSFSANSRYLTFSSNRAGGAGGYDIYLLEFTTLPDDTLLVNVANANSIADDRQPSVSDNGNVIVFQSNRTDTGAQGKIDVWNYRRSPFDVGQAAGYDSPGDDIEPSLKWPN